MRHRKGRTVYLLAASLLAVLATLGLTVVICDAVFGSPDLVYFVPFADRNRRGTVTTARSE